MFDDALIFARLGHGLSMGFGLRASKKDQDAIKALSELDVLTPQLVMDRWRKTLNIATADIVKASLRRNVQGFASGTRRLEIDVQDGRTYAFMAHRNVKEPLARMLKSVLGDQVDASLGDISRSSLEALTESRKRDKP